MWNFRAQRFVLFRILKEIHKLHDFAFGLVTPRDIFKHNFSLCILIQRRHRGLADVENSSRTAPHAAHTAHASASSAKVQPSSDE